MKHNMYGVLYNYWKYKQVNLPQPSRNFDTQSGVTVEYFITSNAHSVYSIQLSIAEWRETVGYVAGWRNVNAASLTSFSRHANNLLRATNVNVFKPLLNRHIPGIGVVSTRTRHLCHGIHGIYPAFTRHPRPGGLEPTINTWGCIVVEKSPRADIVW